VLAQISEDVVDGAVGVERGELVFLADHAEMLQELRLIGAMILADVVTCADVHGRFPVVEPVAPQVEMYPAANVCVDLFVKMLYTDRIPEFPILCAQARPRRGQEVARGRDSQCALNSSTMLD